MRRPEPPPDIHTLQHGAQVRLLTQLRHDDVAAFVARYYWRERTPLVHLHHALSLAALAAWVASCVAAGYGLDGWFTATGWAVLSMLALLPVHELIHGAMYRALGARDV